MHHTEPRAIIEIILHCWGRRCTWNQGIQGTNKRKSVQRSSWGTNWTENFFYSDANAPPMGTFLHAKLKEMSRWNLRWIAMAWACFLFLKTLIAGRFYLCFTPLNRDNRSLGCVPNWQVVVKKEELREEVVCELLEFQTIFSIKTTFRPLDPSCFRELSRWSQSLDHRLRQQRSSTASLASKASESPWSENMRKDCIK